MRPGPEPVTDHVGGPERDPDADRERPAGADGSVDGGDARAREGARVCPQGQGEVRRRPFARRIFRACRRRRLLARRCCALVEAARPGDAGGRAGRQGCHDGAARRRHRAARKVAEAAAQGEVCQVANDNEPTQVVLSGEKTALDRVPEIGKAHRGAPRRAAAGVRTLPLRADATCRRGDARGAGQRQVNAPVVPVIANVVAGPISDPEEIKKRLVEQVTGTVRWRECVTYMTANGITDVYEIGAGKVLAGLAKRIDAALNATSIGTPADIDAALGPSEVRQISRPGHRANFGIKRDTKNICLLV